MESIIQNISEEVDHDSLGLFQQRASWGTTAQRLNPTWATNAFLNKMLNVYPNNSWMSAPIGQVCQAVQVSAYPDRYQVQVGDGVIIADALWTPPPPPPPVWPVTGDWDGNGTYTPGFVLPVGTVWRFYLSNENRIGAPVAHTIDYGSGSSKTPTTPTVRSSPSPTAATPTHPSPETGMAMASGRRVRRHR